MTLTKDIKILYTITGRSWWIVTTDNGVVTMYKQDGISVIRYTSQNDAITNTFVNKKIVNRRQ
jgi:hypothetical protein